MKLLVPHASQVYVDVPANSIKSMRRKSLSFLQRLSQAVASDNDELIDSISNSLRRPLAPQLGKLRSIKSKAEQRVMKAAADISGRAHAKVYRDGILRFKPPLKDYLDYAIYASRSVRSFPSCPLRIHLLPCGLATLGLCASGGIRVSCLTIDRLSYP